jgi:hypothetical protein
MYYTKKLSLKNPKSDQGTTPDQLRKINNFALKELDPEEIDTRRFLLCHNMIDRDNERFSETILGDFAKTLPGKSLLLGHNVNNLGKGLFFDARTETMSPLEFKSLTGEEACLPEGINTVMVLFAWVYMLKIPANEEIIANIEAGIYRHVSIGFKASDVIAIKKETNGPVLFWEYAAPGEAREGSLVYLGAQPGATIKRKTAKKDHPLAPETNRLNKSSSTDRKKHPLDPDGDNVEYGKKHPLDPDGDNVEYGKKHPLDPDGDNVEYGKKHPLADNDLGHDAMED